MERWRIVYITVRHWMQGTYGIQKLEGHLSEGTTDGFCNQCLTCLDLKIVGCLCFLVKIFLLKL